MRKINWQDLSVSDVVLAAILAAANLGVDGFAREFKAILQKPKAEWFNDPETDREAALVTRALDEDTGTEDDKLQNEFVDAVRAALDGPQDAAALHGEEK